jgi:Zn-dependent M28 family amino/carboxypeptidase
MSRALRNGWRPKRSLFLCSWSGEEYGLLGSTAWGEAQAEGVLKNAAVYLNVDVGVSGRTLSVGATASLGPLVADVLTHVLDPDTKKPLSSLWSHELKTLGSGSDYTVFLDRYVAPWRRPLACGCSYAGIFAVVVVVGVAYSSPPMYIYVCTQACMYVCLCQ